MIRQQRPIRNAEVGGLKPFAYKLVRQMNEELEEKGFITIAGRVSRKYYEEKFYGMDEAAPYLYIDFIPYTTRSKRGLETRVSLKKALAELGFKGGTRCEAERN